MAETNAAPAPSKGIKIFKFMQSIPGGLMIVPMFIVAIINTIAPDILRIGSATTAAFTSTGTMTIIGIIMVISGSSLKIGALGAALKRGGVLCIVKILVGLATFFAADALFGPDGFMGISLIAIFFFIDRWNTVIYMALINDYGDNVDKSVFGPMNVIAVPALPLLIMSIGQGGESAIMSAVGVFVPFLIGMLLGNLDDTFAKVLAPGTPICLMFMGCCFGSNINLVNAVLAGPSAILLGLIYFVVTLPIFLLADRGILRRPGYAGIAMSSVAGIAVSCPAIIAEALPQYAPYVATATAQLALVVALTNFIVPFVTRAVVKKFGCAPESPKGKELA